MRVPRVANPLNARQAWQTWMTSIILSPHFDDAVLSLGGMLAGETGRVIVATLFAGIPPYPMRGLWDLCCGFRDSNQAMRVRMQENEDSLVSCGIPRMNIRNYPHLDHQYRGAMARKDSLQALKQMLARNIGALLDECSGTHVRIFAPGLEVHPDHALVKQALLTVRNATGGDNVDFFLYQDLPYSFALLRGGQRALEHLEARMQHATPSLQRHTIALSPEHLNAKLEAVKHHASQIKALTIGTKLRTAKLGLFRKNLSDILTRYAAMQAEFVGLPGAIARSFIDSGSSRPRADSAPAGETG